jgi:hypothetical protein
MDSPCLSVGSGRAAHALFSASCAFSRGLARTEIACNAADFHGARTALPGLAKKVAGSAIPSSGSVQLSEDQRSQIKTIIGREHGWSTPQSNIELMS